MEVLGMRSKAGIWWEDTRRSLREVRGALDVAIVDMGFRTANDKRMKVSNQRGCKRSERAFDADVL